MRARDLLNKLKWSEEASIEGLIIEIVHRGAPGDRKKIEGNSIMELGRSFFTYNRGGEETYIPYHRITKIIDESGEIIWER